MGRRHEHEIDGLFRVSVDMGTEFECVRYSHQKQVIFIKGL